MKATTVNINETIMFKNFQYNKYGVCLNPEVVYSAGRGNIAMPTIEIAICEGPQGWDVSVHICTLTGGCGWGGTYHGDFPSRDRAIHHGIAAIRNRAVETFEKEPYLSDYRKFEEWAVKQTSPQLSIFNTTQPKK